MSVPPRVSVCMATYNGRVFVEEQIASILAQLDPGDEVIVVDDASSDDTADVVSAIGDPRIQLVRSNVNRGYVQTFGAALSRAQGAFVLLADQDDIWRPGRVEAMVTSLGTHDVVATNLAVHGHDGGLRGPYGQQDWHLRPTDSDRAWRNIVGVLAGNRPYYGCAMGVRRDALAAVLPFPAYLVESHDLWLAMYGNLAHSIEHLDLRSVERRFHDSNQTPARPRGPLTVLRSRARLVRVALDLSRRIRRRRHAPEGSLP